MSDDEIGTPIAGAGEAAATPTFTATPAPQRPSQGLGAKLLGAGRNGPPVGRPKPWLSIAVAGIAGLVVLLGAGLIGGESSENWATLTVGIVLVAAYLIEAVATRPVQAACTAIIAMGIPTFVILLITPVHTYNGIRFIMLFTILLWACVYRIGGTRGRAIFCGLALFATWTFAVLEAGHVQDTARIVQDVMPFSTPNLSNSVQREEPDCELYTVDADGNFVENKECSRQYDAAFGRPKVPDYSFGIGNVSLLFGAAFLIGMRRKDSTGNTSVGTAYALPAFIAIAGTVIAYAIKLESVWFGGVLAAIGGLLLGASGNGRRRFTVWISALAITGGIATMSADLVHLWFDTKSMVAMGITWFVSGSIVIAVATKLASDHDDDYAEASTT